MDSADSGAPDETVRVSMTGEKRLHDAENCKNNVEKTKHQ